MPPGGPNSDDAEGPDDRADGGADSAGGGSGPDNSARLARLARKAESARLARLRHKQFVQDKQAEVQALQREEATLLAEEAPATAVALETVRQELRQALTQEQLQVHNLLPCPFLPQSCPDVAHVPLCSSWCPVPHPLTPMYAFIRCMRYALSSSAVGFAKPQVARLSSRRI